MYDPHMYAKRYLSYFEVLKFSGECCSLAAEACDEYIKQPVDELCSDEHNYRWSNEASYCVGHPLSKGDEIQIDWYGSDYDHKCIIEHLGLDPDKCRVPGMLTLFLPPQAVKEVHDKLHQSITRYIETRFDNVDGLDDLELIDIGWVLDPEVSESIEFVLGGPAATLASACSELDHDNPYDLTPDYMERYMRQMQYDCPQVSTLGR